MGRTGRRTDQPGNLADVPCLRHAEYGAGDAEGAGGKGGVPFREDGGVVVACQVVVLELCGAARRRSAAGERGGSHERGRGDEEKGALTLPRRKMKCSSNKTTV